MKETAAAQTRVGTKMKAAKGLVRSIKVRMYSETFLIYAGFVLFIVAVMYVLYVRVLKLGA